MSQFVYFHQSIERKSNVPGIDLIPLISPSIWQRLSESFNFDRGRWLEMRTSDGLAFEEIFDDVFTGHDGVDDYGRSVIDLINQLNLITDAIVFVYGGIDEELSRTYDLDEFLLRVSTEMEHDPVEIHLAYCQF